MPKTPRRLPRWRITFLHERKQELGEVDAADETGAIRAAARAFQVRDVDIPRLAARLVKQESPRRSVGTAPNG